MEKRESENRRMENSFLCEQWLQEIIAGIDNFSGRDIVIIAIDGRCAAGKSSLGKLLGEYYQADVIHMDDFYLPVELRTLERLSQPGGNVHYERFAQEVMPGLKRGTDFAYKRFDCSKMELGEECRVRASRVRIVEGAYSCHPKLGAYMDLCIFLDVEQENQQERIKLRNGEEKLPDFLNKWIPLEEAYFTAFQIKEKADIVLE